MPETYVDMGERDDRIDDPEWLRARYHDDGWSQSDIAAEFGVTQKTVHYYMVKHGIERRPTAPEQDICPRVTLSVNGIICCSAELCKQYDFITEAETLTIVPDVEQRYLYVEFYPDGRGENAVSTATESQYSRRFHALTALREVDVYPSLLSEGHRVPYAVDPETATLVIDLSGSPAVWDPEADAEVLDE